MTRTLITIIIAITAPLFIGHDVFPSEAYLSDVIVDLESSEKNLLSEGDETENLFRIDVYANTPSSDLCENVDSQIIFYNAKTKLNYDHQDTWEVCGLELHPESAWFTYLQESETGNEMGSFSCQKFSLRGNALVDSYDYSLGPYGEFNSDSFGHIFSNNEVELTGSSVVRGNITAHNISLLGNSTIEGSQVITEELWDCFTAMVEEIEDTVSTINNNNAIGLTSAGISPFHPSDSLDFKLVNGESITLNEGLYYFDSLTLQGNSFLNIEGHVIIYCQGKIEFDGTSSTNYEGDPNNLAIYSLGNSINLNGSAKVYAQLFSTSGQIKLSGHSSVFGKLFANNIELIGNASLHFNTYNSDSSLQFVITYLFDELNNTIGTKINIIQLKSFIILPVISHFNDPKQWTMGTYNAGFTTTWHETGWPLIYNELELGYSFYTTSNDFIWMRHNYNYDLSGAKALVLRMKGDSNPNNNYHFCVVRIVTYNNLMEGVYAYKFWIDFTDYREIVMPLKYFSPEQLGPDLSHTIRVELFIDDQDIRQNSGTLFFDYLKPSGNDGLNGLTLRAHMFYYGWYNGHVNGGHWEQSRNLDDDWDGICESNVNTYNLGWNNVGADHYPFLSDYVSNDDATISQHMNWIANKAKIGVIALSWWGIGSWESDQLLSKLFYWARQYHVKICLHLENYKVGHVPPELKAIPKFTPAELMNSIRHFINRARNEGYYDDVVYKVPGDGRPLAYVWAATLHEPTEWQATDAIPSIRDTPYDTMLIALSRDLTYFVIPSGFDGGYDYGVARRDVDFVYNYDRNGNPQPPHWGSTLGDFWDYNKMWVPMVGPGYSDNRAVCNHLPWWDGPGEHPGYNFIDLPRSGDSMCNSAFCYDYLWNEVLKTTDNRDKIVFTVITSFNEWHEGTQIEPASISPPAPTYDSQIPYMVYPESNKFFYLDKTASYGAQLDNKQYRFPWHDSTKDYSDSEEETSGQVEIVMDEIEVYWNKLFYVCNGTMSNIGSKMARDISVTIDLMVGNEIIGSITSSPQEKNLGPGTTTGFSFYIAPYDYLNHGDIAVQHFIDWLE
ncbi:hypothetical protein JXQ70_10270 [bacterium]|nr:hypothetical protein [bacterium]